MRNRDMSNNWKGFFAFVTSPIMKTIVVIVLIGVSVWLYKIATEQFSPEVQRIKVENDSWKECRWIGIESSLYHQGIASMKEGGQYFDFQAMVRPTKVTDVQDTVLSRYNYKAGLSITSSGTDFKCIDYEDDNWHIDDPNYLSEAVKITKKDKHTYSLESRTNSDFKLLDIAIKGDNIFCESNSRNPYIAFHIDFSGITLSDQGNGYLSFYYERDTTNLPGKPYLSPLNLITVYPQPDFITPTRVYYEKSIDAVLKNGVYIIAEDLSKKRKQDVLSFVSSVLLGVFLSFIVQLIIDLVKDFKGRFGL